MGHIKHHVEFPSSRLLTKYMYHQVPECEQGKKYAIHNIWHFVFNYFLGLQLLQVIKYSNLIFMLN